MGGVSSRYNSTDDIDDTNEYLKRIDKYQLKSNVLELEKQEISGSISIPGETNADAAQELQRIVNKQKQYHLISGKEMSSMLHKLLQQIQLNILANNYNEKNKVLLKKLFNDVKNKQLDLKDSKEANFADYRRMELIQAEIKQKNRTILFVLFANITLLVLLSISFIILKSNMK